jgi:uncharacterized membrane protein
MSSPEPRLSHLPPLVRAVRLHARLFVCCVVGLAVFVLMPSSWTIATRALCGWDAGVLLYLALLVGLVASPSHVARLRQRAAEEDEGAVAITFLAAAAALVSIGAIFVQLAAVKEKTGGMLPHVAFAIATIALSWVFTHTIFGHHYAYRYYSRRSAGGLVFPGKEEPDFWDFLYFSFVIGMTAQVSDVSVTDRKIRRIALAHGILSFVFNTTIIALAVNIASSVI